MFKTALLAGAAVLTLATAGVANATAYTWSFTGGNNSDGFDGNSRTFTSTPGGISVIASAYSASSSSSSLTREALGWYGPGLGVKTSSGDSHTVDNSSRYDLVVFEFASAVDMGSITLTSYGDADITVWIGNKAAGNNFEGGETFNNNLSGLSFIGNYDCDGINPGNCDDDGDVVTYNINAGNILGNYLVVAARIGGDGDGDEFKISGLAADQSTNVAEPGTLAVLGLGLAGLGLVRRRQTAKA